MNPNDREQDDTVRNSARDEPRDTKREETSYTSPKLVGLGRTKDLTRGGCKDKKKDSWNELGFYV